MNRRDAALLAAIQQLSAHMDARFDTVSARLDGVHTRIDTIIDAIADLRTDLRTHRHDDGDQ
jgi:hypothetical protein